MNPYVSALIDPEASDGSFELLISGYGFPFCYLLGTDVFPSL